MTLTQEHIMAALLGLLSRTPAGEPELANHPHYPRALAAGWVTAEGGLTQDGWYALGFYRQDRIWNAAATEHVTRMGPLDAEGLRRLVLEHASGLEAVRRLVAAGQAEAAAQAQHEAQMIKVRLAVQTGVPVGQMDEVAVMLRAMELADQLESTGGLPWRLTAAEAAEALLSS